MFLYLVRLCFVALLVVISYTLFIYFVYLFIGFFVILRLRFNGWCENAIRKYKALNQLVTDRNTDVFPGGIAPIVFTATKEQQKELEKRDMPIEAAAQPEFVEPMNAIPFVDVVDA